jgi:uncharacterized membrane protein SpoIIM required for sporulation
MIVNLEKFIVQESPGWERLDAQLRRLADDPWRKLTKDEVRELERLYQRAAADLARLATFEAEPEARRYLENLVARAYAEIHGVKAETRRFKPVRWFTRTFPQVWRRQARAFWIAFSFMMVGAVFGGAAIAFDPSSKTALMPFAHLQGDPAERVAREETNENQNGEDGRATFSGQLMTHNTRVTLMAMALGMTWGVGTLIVIFSNGVMLGAVAIDYVLAGQTEFLLGWLLPHGVIEIPAMLVGGQAGFVLAVALLGRGQRESLSTRLRKATPDVVTLCFGAAVMLIWAGLVEAFLSQYHEPVLPYSVKILFGVVELAALSWYLLRVGREKPEQKG